jgi:hypothetical protein
VWQTPHACTHDHLSGPGSGDDRLHRDRLFLAGSHHTPGALAHGAEVTHDVGCRSAATGSRCLLLVTAIAAVSTSAPLVREPRRPHCIALGAPLAATATAVLAPAHRTRTT